MAPRTSKLSTRYSLHLQQPADNYMIWWLRWCLPLPLTTTSCCCCCCCFPQHRVKPTTGSVADLKPAEMDGQPTLRPLIFRDAALTLILNWTSYLWKLLQLHCFLPSFYFVFWNLMFFHLHRLIGCDNILPQLTHLLHCIERYILAPVQSNTCS